MAVLLFASATVRDYSLNDNLVATIDAIFMDNFSSYVKQAEAHTQNSDVSWVPDGWVLSTADNIFNISIGKTPPRSEPEWFSFNKENNYVWVSIADMKTNSPFIEDSSEYLIPAAVKKHNVKVVPANSVLLSFKMTVGRVAITKSAITTNEAIAHFPCDNGTLAYAYCYLKNFNYDSLGSTSSITTAINSRIIKEMPFLLPSSEELDAFNNRCIPILDELNTINKELAKLNQLLNVLLPQLLLSY